MIRVAHVINSIDKDSGGTSTYMKLVIESLDKKVKQHLITTSSEGNIPINANVKVDLFQKNEILNFYSKKMNMKFKNLNIDLVHGNGLWQLLVHQMAVNARKMKLPYIISTHGMLEPWSLTQSKIKKQLALKLFQYKDLADASCIHATAPMEVESIRNLGLKNPIAMIPNGVNISEFPVDFAEKKIKPKKILFLSRIHIKKGIENLIEAWKLINLETKKDWIIEIVGNGEENYIQSLKDKIVLENLATQIIIKPPVFGQKKINLFREASLFVLPTFSENFGIVIAEALASYTPVITTKGTPWEDLETHNCGWWIDIGVEPLKEALLKAIQTNNAELQIMGINGRKLIEEKYSMESVAKQMMQLYEWLVFKTKKPNFVNIKK